MNRYIIASQHLIIETQNVNLCQRLAETELVSMSNDQKTQVVYEEVYVGKEQAQISAPSKSTIEDIILMAKSIQKEVKDSKIPIQDVNGRNMLFNKLKTKYKNFYDSLPIVFNWMIQLDEFNPKALRLFMKRNPSLYWKTQDGWIDAYAGYLTDVFRFKHNHIDESRVKAYREMVFKSLKKDADDFHEKYNEVKTEVDKEEASLDKERREKLKIALLKKKLDSSV